MFEKYNRLQTFLQQNIKYSICTERKQSIIDILYNIRDINNIYIHYVYNKVYTKIYDHSSGFKAHFLTNS